MQGRAVPLSRPADTMDRTAIAPPQMSTTKQEIAENIRRIQQAAKVTDSYVAQRANIDPSTLSHYRNGRSRPRPETVVAIAFALNCHPTEIDPTLADEFRRDASWFVEATTETRALFVEWSRLSNETQRKRQDLASTLKTLQEHCAFIEMQIQESQLQAEVIERRLASKMAEMQRRQRGLEAIAGYRNMG